MANLQTTFLKTVTLKNETDSFLAEIHQHLLLLDPPPPLLTSARLSSIDVF
jgi:hypothetical protein